MAPEGAVYIGRAVAGLSQSPLANPFKVDDFDEPTQCLHAYGEHLLEQLVAGGEAVLALARLSWESTLACWCAERPAWVPSCGRSFPSRPCHGDVVAQVFLGLEPELRAWTSVFERADDGRWAARPGRSLTRWRREVAALGPAKAREMFGLRCFGRR